MMKRRPRMIIKLCAFVITGAILNVVVAWGCAYFVNIDEASPARGRFSDSLPTWRVTYQTAIGSLRIDPQWFTGENYGRNDDYFRWEENQFRPIIPDAIPSWSNLDKPILPEDGSNEFWRRHMRQDARGWPVLSLRCEFDPITVGWRNNVPPIPVQSFRIEGDQVIVLFAGEEIAEPLRGSGVHNGILVKVARLGTTGLEIRLLPFCPIWPGFAINTVFYAAVLWLMSLVPGGIRRVIRSIRAHRGLCPACAYPIGTNPLCTECGKPVPKRLEA